MKYELKIEADTVDELLGLFNNLKDRPINEIPKANKVTVELADEPAPAHASMNQSAPQPDHTPTVTVPTQAPVTSKKAYTVDELARAAAPLMDKTEGVKMLQELLASYGVVSLGDLDKSLYNDFAEKLRNLGVEV